MMNSARVIGMDLDTENVDSEGVTAIPILDLPLTGQSLQPSQLSPSHRFQTRSSTMTSTRANLTNHRHPPLLRDKINLPRATAPVAIQNYVSGLGEISGCELLPVLANLDSVRVWTQLHGRWRKILLALDFVLIHETSGPVLS